MRGTAKEWIEMNGSLDVSRLPVNLGIVLRADDLETAKTFLGRLERLVKDLPGLRAVFKDLSVDKLWIKRGDGP